MTSCTCYRRWLDHTEALQFWQSLLSSACNDQPDQQKTSLWCMCLEADTEQWIPSSSLMEEPFLAPTVSQIVDLGFKHIALGRLQLEAVFLEVIEYHMHSLQMLFRHLRENYRVIQVDEAIGEVQFCMSLWKVGGALHSPKGILLHSYKAMLPNVKAVYCLDSSSMGTC